MADSFPRPFPPNPIPAGFSLDYTHDRMFLTSDIEIDSRRRAAAHALVAAAILRDKKPNAGDFRR